VGIRARRHRRDLERDRERGARAGVEIRTEAPVAHIRVHGGQANGVVLANGDELDATLVVSSVDPISRS